MKELIDKAQAFSDREDGNNAIVILEAITDTCQQEWDELENYGLDFDQTGEVLDAAWTHAILSVELTPEEKVDLQVTLEDYQDELQGSFEMSLEALRQGWDYPPLLEVFQGDRSRLWGDSATALAARTQAFQLRPSFADYRRIESLADETWPSVKIELLEAFRSWDGWNTEQAKIDIYLHEGLLDDAIATIKANKFCSEHLVHRVLETAVEYQPDWMIATAQTRAEEIMNRGKAEIYDQAAEWLGKARAAYLAVNRRSDWSIYRSHLMQIHGRKYKLMGFLNQPALA